MNDFDEDIDPYGPLADLMTDHNLSSPITKKTIIKEQQQQFDLTKTNHSLLNEVKIVLSKNFNVYFNVHLLFKYIFSYFLSSQWHHIHRILEVNDIDELADYENNKQKLRKRASSSIKKLFIVCMWSLYLSNLKVYFQIIQSNQTWMSQISGFQLIRPTTSSSLLDTKLFSLRHALFSQLRQCFLHTYQASRSLTAMIEWMKSDYDHLSCHIDLNEFGPILSSSNNDTLNELTNKYDLSAINSTKKLCLTQIHEYIQLMQFYMLDILQIRAGSQTASLLKVIKDIKNLNDLLTVSIEEIQIVRQKCSLIDYVDNLSPNSVIQVSSKFRSASVLLRLCCEQLFEIDRQNMISVDENILTRIIYDIKTACHFIEDIRGKQVVTSENPHLFSAQHTKEDAENQVTSFYRYDDKPLEYVDEVLTCDTGTEQSALEERNTTEVDYDQKFLAEQTKSLMNELRNAIETKKQEWNEREEKLLNIKPTNSSEIVEKVIHHETEPLVESMQPFITQHEINKNCSMLDELKQTFVINKEKMNLNEDVFGEEEDEDEDQDDDDDDESESNIFFTTCFDDARQDQSGPALIRYLADKSNETDLFDILCFRTTTLTGFFLYWIPIICILSPSYLCPFGFVDGTQEFKVYRMQQFDLYGQTFGSRQAYLSSEVRIWSQPNIQRKTVLIHLNKLTIERFRQLISKGINGLFILIPNMSNRWLDEQKQQLCDVEQILLQESVQIPVYFLQETQQTIDLYKAIESRRDSQKDSAFSVLYDKVTADGYQFSISQGRYQQRQDNVMYNIQGKLIGHGIEERLPKILFVAHYDTLGIATGLSYGADSNASGLLVLLKLIRLFSKLYAKQTTRAKYNLLFLFSAGGKLNYQGSKRWIDDYHDQQQQQQLQNDIDVVICLDALGQSNQLYMHVSKPPRDTQSAGILRDLLTRLSEKSVYGQFDFDQIHKKILKTSDFVAWEHEKYSWSKLPAFTFSHLNTSKTCQHSTISDLKEDVQLSSLDKNFHYISDALIRLLYNTTDLNMSIIDHKYIMSQQQSIYDQQFLKIWLNFLTSYSRSQSLLTKQHPVLIALEQYAQNYLQHVQKIPIRPHSKKDPEFIFYDGDEEARLLYVYRVKPAIFDLVLASFIAIYLGIIYLCANNWTLILNYILLHLHETLFRVSDDLRPHLILTTGGTGISPTDVTPEATREVITKEIPGMSLAMVSKSLNITPMAMLSRSVCGVYQQTLIVNLPGSRKGCLECLEFVYPVLYHAIDLIQDKKLDISVTHNILKQDGVQLTDTTTKSDEVIVKHTCHHQNVLTTNQQNSGDRVRESPYPTIPVADASEMILNNANELIVTEKPLADCLGYVCAKDIHATHPFPPFRASIKDGYAVRLHTDETKRVYEIVGRADAGDNINVQLEQGQCVIINTGAKLPDSADAVIQIEDTDIDEKHPDSNLEKSIRIKTHCVKNQDIRKIGDDISIGELVLKKNVQLGPSELGLLVTIGSKHVKVYEKPTVTVISTGNELVAIDDEPKDGQIRDSNKIMLLSALKELGINAIDGGTATDQENSVVEILQSAFDKSDIVITTGGVSMGDKDLLKSILTTKFDGTIHFGRLNMKPGKPTTFATCEINNRKKMIFALPGNPVSALVTYWLLVVPLLKHLMGYASPNYPIISVKLEQPIDRLDIRPEYQRVVINWSSNATLPTVRVIGNQCSSRLMSVSRTNGLIRLPGRQDNLVSLDQYSIVDCLLLAIQ